MDSQAQRIPGYGVFSTRSAPLVVRSSSLRDAERMHARRLCTMLGFRVRVAYLRLRQGTPLTKWEERLISVGPDLLSLLLDISQAASASDGEVDSLRTAIPSTSRSHE